MTKAFITLSTIPFVSVITLFTGSAWGAAGDITVSVESSLDKVTWSASSPGVVDVSVTEPYYRVQITPDGGAPTPGGATQASTAHFFERVRVILESNTDLSSWATDSTGVQNISGGQKFFRIRTETAYDNFVFVAGGNFLMGIGERDTTVSDFYMGKYEVTYEEWNLVQAWGASNGYTDLPTASGCASGDHPTVNMDWYDAVKWCNARSEMEGRTPVYYTDDLHTTIYRTGDHDVTNVQVLWSADGYRLPTEAEWEFAAKGGNSSMDYLYSGSDTIDDVAWYSSNSAGADCGGGSNGTWPVGRKFPNELGLVDMSGNAIEWCWDWYGTSLAAGPITDPLGPTSGFGNARVKRGGHYNTGEANCRVETRGGTPLPGAENAKGFRLVYR